MLNLHTTDAIELVKELGLTREAIIAINNCADGYVKYAKSMHEQKIWTSGQANDYLLSVNCHRLYEDLNMVISAVNKRG